MLYQYPNMKVSGFTFIRNAIKYDFPVVEAIRSILPICNDVHVAVGQSDDDTMALIQSIDPKVNAIETIWDESLRKGGKVLAVETDKAKSMIPDDTDWCIYIQADEVLHEKCLDIIQQAMQRWKDHPEVDGLLLNYHHFLGTYDYITTSPDWYRREIRIIRNDPSIYSYRDAQGFRKGNNKKLRVKHIDAYVYHYGLVKHPKVQYEKRKNSFKYYDGAKVKEVYEYNGEEMDYGAVDILQKFDGTHPEVMKERISQMNWDFEHDLSINRMSLKNRFRKWMEKHTGYIPWEYRNYKII